jgi:hypothetical protein
MNNAAYASLYQGAIEAGRTRLADRMEAAGASLANLPLEDRQDLGHEAQRQWCGPG